MLAAAESVARNAVVVLDARALAAERGIPLHLRHADAVAAVELAPDHLPQYVGALVIGSEADLAVVRALVSRLASFATVIVLNDVTIAGSPLADARQWVPVVEGPAVRMLRRAEYVSGPHAAAAPVLELVVESELVNGIVHQVHLPIALPPPPVSAEGRVLADLAGVLERCMNTSAAAEHMIEGHVAQSPFKVALLRDLGRNSLLIRTICEIGFNVGHSSVVWLENNRDAVLYSFDFCGNVCTDAVVAFMRRRYGSRFVLTCGDSRETVPAFARAHPEVRCDIMHVDGGHEGDVPLADLRNMRPLAHPAMHTLLMDDVACTAAYCEAPQRAWDAMTHAGLVVQRACVRGDNTWNGMCVGRYS